MTKCPHCKQLLKCENCGKEYHIQARICSKKIALTKRTEGQVSGQKAPESKKLFQDSLIEYLNGKNGQEIRTNDILMDFQMIGSTEGDTIRLMLDNFVCSGRLDKLEFNRKTGHIYRIKETIEPCKYAQENPIFWNCIAPSQEFRYLDSEEVK